MELLNDLGGYQAAFGAEDISSPAMKRAVGSWFDHYYDRNSLMQLPYTIVRKLVCGMFAEYGASGSVLKSLPERTAMELALIGGECYLKPVMLEGQWHWRAIPRGSILVFARDWHGQPTDVGLMEKTRKGRFYYTLLERRKLDSAGYLTVTNRLFRSGDRGQLGREVKLSEQPMYKDLPARYTYPMVLDGVGLVRLKMPMANCIDGSREGVSIYAAALPLMAAIEENEKQLQEEFRNGKSRLVVSRDMLRDGQLKDSLFVGLDESPENVGITQFAPELRTQSFLERQQSYLKLLENVIGLKRGILSQVEAVDRTATEVTSSEGEYKCLLVDLQKCFEEVALECAALAGKLDGNPEDVQLSWGDGVV